MDGWNERASLFNVPFFYDKDGMLQALPIRSINISHSLSDWWGEHLIKDLY